jgi:hypothetical protein
MRTLSYIIIDESKGLGMKESRVWFGIRVLVNMENIASMAKLE